MRYYSYLNTALHLIALYKGGEPLSVFLKHYFSQYKKYGGKDRKYITHLCYCYYRLGFALTELPAEERLKTALFLCNGAPQDWAVLFTDNWQLVWSKSIEERIAFVQQQYSFNVIAIFPFINEISDNIDAFIFVKSHLVQPCLFLRIRPKQETLVIDKLQRAGISFTKKKSSCIALNNSTKLDTIISLNKEAVVQDYSSQRVAELLEKVTATQQPLKVWDCCAASGGKSILATDILPGIKLTVSDIRQSIINNLHKRFKEAGIKNYTSFIADLGNPQAANHHQQYDLIICDVPCSGSGTWARTPEQLFFFTEQKLEHYISLQKQITNHIVPSLRKNGFLLYITCSVYRKENEEITAHILQNTSLQLVEEKLLQGYTGKADTMYAVLFKNS